MSLEDSMAAIAALRLEQKKKQDELDDLKRKEMRQLSWAHSLREQRRKEEDKLCKNADCVAMRAKLAEFEKAAAKASQQEYLNSRSEEWLSDHGL